MKHVKECCFLFDEKSHSKDDCWFEPPGEMQQTNPWHSLMQRAYKCILLMWKTHEQARLQLHLKMLDIYHVMARFKCLCNTL